MNILTVPLKNPVLTKEDAPSAIGNSINSSRNSLFSDPWLHNHHNLQELSIHKQMLAPRHLSHPGPSRRWPEATPPNSFHVRFLFGLEKWFTDFSRHLTTDVFFWRRPVSLFRLHHSRKRFRQPSRKANVQATDWTVQDLNLDPKLPYGDAEFLGMLEGWVALVNFRGKKYGLFQMCHVWWVQWPTR